MKTYFTAVDLDKIVTVLEALSADDDRAADALIDALYLKLDPSYLIASDSLVMMTEALYLYNSTASDFAALVA